MLTNGHSRRQTLGPDIWSIIPLNESLNGGQKAGFFRENEKIVTVKLKGIKKLDFVNKFKRIGEHECDSNACNNFKELCIAVERTDNPRTTRNHPDDNITKIRFTTEKVFKYWALNFQRKLSVTIWSILI